MDYVSLALGVQPTNHQPPHTHTHARTHVHWKKKGGEEKMKEKRGAKEVMAFVIVYKQKDKERGVSAKTKKKKHGF